MTVSDSLDLLTIAKRAVRKIQGIRCGSATSAVAPSVQVDSTSIRLIKTGCSAS